MGTWNSETGDEAVYLVDDGISVMLAVKMQIVELFFGVISIGS